MPLRDQKKNFALKMTLVYVENTVTEDKVIILVFSIFIILAIILFFSKYLNDEEENPIDISTAQFDLIANKAKIPEGLSNKNLDITSGDILNPEDVSLGELFKLGGLKECPENECAIDLATGVKRCAQNSNTRIVYDSTFEACTSKYFCTAEALPYAILSSGETDTQGVCEKDIVCRCSPNIICPKYVLSSFNLRDGTKSDSNSSYYFDQTVLGDDKIVGYESIVIDASSEGDQFCGINPGYTDRINSGCDFSNADNDILGCVNSYDFFELSDVAFQDISDLNLSYQDTSSQQTINYQSSLNIQQSDKPEKGYMVVKQQDDNILQIVSYSKFSPNIKTFKSGQAEDGTPQYKDLSISGSISSYTVDSSNNTGTIELGTPTSLSEKSVGAGGDILSFMNVVYTGCRSSGDDTSAGNKNMLLCTQQKNQPCSKGLLAYNVDNKKASQFCQSKPSLAEYLQNGGDYTKLKLSDTDPRFYTMSCVIGAGCNGDYDTSTCKNGDCTSSIQVYKNLFQDYDSNALNNSWVLKKSDKYLSGVITYSYSDSDGIKMKNDGLLNIQPGDYFSTVNTEIQKLTVKDTSVTTSPVTIYLNSVDDLENGFTVFFTGYKGTINSIDSDQRSISVTNVGTPSIKSIPAFSLIRTFFFSSGDGNDFGRIAVGADGRYFPYKTNDFVVGDISSATTIYVYKQFGFNGLNYNTNLVLTPTEDNSAIDVYREYSDVSQWYYWLGSYTDNIPTNMLQTPLSSAIVPLVKYAQEQNKTITKDVMNSMVFSSPEADFKSELSFYYPVWEPEKINQGCIMCKPALYTYTKIDTVGHIKSIVIQYSGKDFSQYIFQPQLTPSSNYYSPDSSKPMYCFNIFTTISQTEDSSSGRIVLDTINPNLPLSSSVDPNYYVDYPYYLLDSNNIIRRNVKLVSDSKDINAPGSVKLSMIPLSAGMEEITMLEDCYKSYVFDGQTLGLKPNQQTSFIYSSNDSSYSNFSPDSGSNWFSGIKYYSQPLISGSEGLAYFLVQGQTQITKVDIVNGKQVIWTNSVTAETIPKTRDSNARPTVLQIYSTQDTLDVKYDRQPEDDLILVDSITEGRITNFKLRTATNQQTYNIDNLPQVRLTKYRDVQ